MTAFPVTRAAWARLKTSWGLYMADGGPIQHLWPWSTIGRLERQLRTCAMRAEIRLRLSTDATFRLEQMTRDRDLLLEQGAEHRAEAERLHGACRDALADMYDGSGRDAAAILRAALSDGSAEGVASVTAGQTSGMQNQ